MKEVRDIAIQGSKEELAKPEHHHHGLHLNIKEHIDSYLQVRNIPLSALVLTIAHMY